MRKENELIEQKELREQMINRVEVLDRVGELLLLPNTEFATMEQVSKYYGVKKNTIERVTERNKEELVTDGYGVRKQSEALEMLNPQTVGLERKTGKVSVFHGEEIISIPNRGVKLFPKRAILRVGMLLRDSEVAKEIRTRLLDVVQDVSEGKENIVENIINEISEEKQLMLDRVEAETNGDYDKVCIINAKLFALKNKRIQELENKINIISTNALTISESRTVINKLVRLIAVKEYNNMFGVAYNNLYKQINYKLGINLKQRNKKSTQSYIDILTNEEVKEVEIIVRNWAEKVGISVEKELNLAS